MKRAWTRLSRYVREDLREIAAPSSLPDPPGAALKRRLTLKQWREVRLFYFDQMRYALISPRTSAVVDFSDSDSESRCAAVDGKTTWHPSSESLSHQKQLKRIRPANLAARRGAPAALQNSGRILVSVYSCFNTEHNHMLRFTSWGASARSTQSVAHLGRVFAAPAPLDLNLTASIHDMCSRGSEGRRGPVAALPAAHVRRATVGVAGRGPRLRGRLQGGNGAVQSGHAHRGHGRQVFAPDRAGRQPGGRAGSAAGGGQRCRAGSARRRRSRALGSINGS